MGCDAELRVGQARLCGRELAWEHDCEECHGRFEATGGCVVGLALQDLESCQPAQVKQELVSRDEEAEQLSHTHVGVRLERPRLCVCLLHVGLLSRMGRVDGTAGRETSFCREESCSQRGLQESYGSGNVSKFFSFILSFSSGVQNLLQSSRALRRLSVVLRVHNHLVPRRAFILLLPWIILDCADVSLDKSVREVGSSF